MYLKKKNLGILLIMVIACIVVVQADNALQPPTIITPVSTGNFWVNYTWEKGANTDSFNVSVNGTWTNGTKDLFKNTTSSPHGWVNITLAGFNSASGQLSAFVYMNTPIPNNRITLRNVDPDYSLYEGQTLNIDADYTDIDGDKGTFSTTANKTGINSSTGVLSWKTKGGDRGIYYWQISVTDGYGNISATSNQTFTVTVNPNIPRPPTILGFTTGNFWVNYFWEKGANTDSFNLSINGKWTNGTKDLSRNTTSSPHGQVNILIAGYNQTSQMLSSFSTQNTEIPNNPISLTNVSSSYFLYEGQTLYIDADYTDADGDSGIFTTNANKTGINRSTGVLAWKTSHGDKGTYNWQINVTDGYAPNSSQSFIVTVNTYIPGRPNLAYTTGYFWVNHTWSPVDYADSYNVSVNGIWTNGTKNLFKNTTSSPHGWVNISVAGYNATSRQLSEFEHMDTRVPNNPITLTNVSSSYFFNEGQTLYINAGYTDDDGEEGFFNLDSKKGTFNSSSGVFSWATTSGDGGVYNWQFSVSDGYGSISTQQIKVIIPMSLILKFIEPVLKDNTEVWIDATQGHAGKFIGYYRAFKNTGDEPLNLIMITEYNSTYEEISKKLEPNEFVSERQGFFINPDGIEDGLFNFTEKIYVNGTTFNYINTTSISLPILPIYEMKKANGFKAYLSEGSITNIHYTLKVNASVNLTNVSIYDPFYPDKYFNISRFEVEGNNSRCYDNALNQTPCSINFKYPATIKDLSRYNCDGISCIVNTATFTGTTDSGELINDTEYVRIWAIGAAISANSGGRNDNSGGGGGGGGGVPPSEDFKNIEHREVRERDVLANSASVYTFKNADPVMVVGFESSVSENGVPVAVEVLKNRSKYIDADAPGQLYRYFNIFVGTSGFNKKISKGVVAFAVNNSWLAQNGLAPGDISLYKWDGGWIEKNTEIAESTPNQTYYASLVGNFSSFAIAGAKKADVSSSAGLMTDTPDEFDNTTNKTLANHDKQVVPYLFISIIALIGGISVYWYFTKIRLR